MTAGKFRPIDPKSGLLPRDVRESLQAVVVDANAYGPVGPDLVGLADLARDLAAIGIRTWVPEPVAWEWAEHLAQQWTTLYEATRGPIRHLRKAGLAFGLTFDPHYADRDALIDALLRKVRSTPNVEIVPLTGDNARAGLRDQILQLSPAKTKSTPPVKTGGSDSAWLRDVLAKAGGQPEQLLFLSSDRDIERAHTQWRLAPPLLRNPGNIRDSLFEGEPLGIDETWLVAQYLVERVGLDREAMPPDEPLLDLPDGLLAALGLDHVENSVATAHLTDVTALAGLGPAMRTRPQDDNDHRHTDDMNGAETSVLTVTAYFLVDAEATLIAQEPSSGEITTRAAGVGTELTLKARLVLEARGREILKARSDLVELIPDILSGADPHGALEELRTVLTKVPGLTLPLEWAKWHEGTGQTVVVQGKQETLDLCWLHEGWDGLRLRLDDEEVLAPWEPGTVSYIGEWGGPRSDSPFPLAFEEIQGHFVRSYWHIPAWIIRRLVEPSLRPPTPVEDPPW